MADVPAELMRRVDEDYQGDVSRVRDLAVADAVFDTVDQVYRALARLSRDPGVSIVRYRDRIADCSSTTGYADVLVNLRASNGHIGTLRLRLASMQRAEEMVSPLREVRRSLREMAWEQGRDLTQRELAMDVELGRRCRGRYDEALDKAAPGREGFTA